MTIDFQGIHRKASRLRNRHGTNDPLCLCRENGIAVEYHDLGSSEDSCKGVFIVVSRIKRILINSALADFIQRIILAHELGHAVLHLNEALKRGQLNEFQLYSETNRLEYEANVFAAEILVSDADMLAALEDAQHNDSRICLNIPDELLDFKLRSMRRRGLDVPEWYTYTYSDFMRGWGMKESRVAEESEEYEAD
jgi:Zn-dependent peptidase ImmA (M78 family)